MDRSPLLSISTAFDYSVPIEKQIPLIAAAGFTHVSLGADETHSGYLSAGARRDLARLLDGHGLLIDTIHAPSVDAPRLDQLTAVTEAASSLHAPVVVFHGGPFAFPDGELAERLDVLLRVCDGLAVVAARTGVVFALENVLPGAATELVRTALARLDPRGFGFCYDSTHDQIGGPRSFELLESLGPRLVATHLSDRVRDYVDHVPPGDGFIDWPALAACLRATRFRGPLLFEVMTKHCREKEAGPFLTFVYERACRIRELMEAGV